MYKKCRNWRKDWKKVKMMDQEVNETRTKYVTWTEKDFTQGRRLKIVSEEGKQYKFEEVDSVLRNSL